MVRRVGQVSDLPAIKQKRARQARSLPHIALLLVWAALAFAAPPARIVSTAPSITELLYALGLGDNVAGVTRFCRYPPEAQLKPKIGDYTSPTWNPSPRFGPTW